jgi:nucleoside-specific outer membrane channel protein Tsx
LFRRFSFMSSSLARSRTTQASKVVATALSSVALSFGMIAVAGTASGAATPVVAKAPARLVKSATPAAATSRVTTPPVGKQLAELVGSDAVAGDDFGISVAVSGGTAVVGATGDSKSPGRAYVFSESAGIWKQLAELQGSGVVDGDLFGNSVAISGHTVVVGAPSYAKRTGSAYVFTETNGVWKQVAELKGSDTVTGDEFGWTVAISGSEAVVGAPQHAKAAGRAYVFTETDGVWKQVAELKGSDTVASDAFGWAVAVSSGTTLVGAPTHAGAGRAYVFTQTSGWKQVAELKGSDTAGADYLGQSVAVSGDTAIVGAPDHGDEAGTAYVFTEAKSAWTQLAELKASDTAPGDFFGNSVAVSGSTAVVGGWGYAHEAGSTYVFSVTKGASKQLAELKGSDTASGDFFGDSVAVSNSTVVVGAPLHADGKGSGYVFEA